MLRNYLLTAYRVLLTQKLFSLINLVGLALGLSVCMLITVYILYEQTYDRFHAHFPTLYRVVQHQNQNGNWYNVARSPAKLAPALEAEFPEVKNATRFALWGGGLLA